MPLKKSTGNMYPWVTHTHSHIGGECPHRCSYCYVDNPRFGRPARYQGELRTIEDEFGVRYGEGRTIFVENCNDLFASSMPQGFIERVLAHCRAWPKNIYVFQTKNPRRMLEFDFLADTLLGVTIETDRATPNSLAPSTSERFQASRLLCKPIFISIEPVLDLDVGEVVEWMRNLRPAFVSVGADSKGHGLPEPPVWKLRMLLDGLTRAGLVVKAKSNLGRLLASSERPAK